MKKVLCILLCVLVLLSLVGCDYSGYDFIDTNYHFNRAIVKMPDGTVEEFNIRSWADAEDCDQLTLTTDDGVRYLVHGANVILVED